MGYRSADTTIKGFNLIVIDVDEGIDINTAKLVLKDYKYLMYTTKSHTDKANRFRVIFPMKYELALTPEDYKEFMCNVYDWLPFKCDTATKDIARKWESYSGEYWYNEGKLIDNLIFIPKTTKCIETKKIITDTKSLNNIERWFCNNIGEGNRSNQLIKYAYLLVDAGKDLDQVRGKIIELNSKISNKLTETEILNTIMVSVSKKIHLRDSN